MLQMFSSHRCMSSGPECSVALLLWAFSYSRFFLCTLKKNYTVLTSSLTAYSVSRALFV